MIDPDATDYELLYYIGERDSDESLAHEAFEVLTKRHYANLLTSCQKSLGALTSGRPVGGIPVQDAARELVNIVLVAVYDGLAKKFNRAPIPGTETRAVRAWLSRIARNYARRQVSAASKQAARKKDYSDNSEKSDSAVAPSVSDLLGLTATKNPTPGDSNSSQRKREIILAAWEELSDNEKLVLKLCIEYGAGWDLGGHATRENSRILCDLLGTTPTALRQRRKRALDKLRAKVDKLHMETNHADTSREKSVATASSSQ